MDVGDVLRDRMVEPQGLERMATISVVAHVILVAFVVFGPSSLLPRRTEAPKAVMTISLGGGAPGPRTGGLTPLGGRPIQQQTPMDAPKRPEAVRPPAAKTPEMTLPSPKAKPAKAPLPQIKQAPEDARGRTPTRGAQVTEGSAVAETGARGQGFGLSTGGGGGTGSYLDVANFCCPDYLIAMTERIRANWNARQDVPGNVIIRFTIQRDGSLTDMMVERGAGYPALDLSAQRAVYMTKQLPPLPAQFPNPSLTVHLNFNYQR